MRFVLACLAFLISTTSWAHTSGCRLAVIVDGVERPEYSANGATYVEALRGRDYSLRLINPTAHRVAVALSVDGLNTIDARHTDGWSAAKWVLDPFETVEISGWQVSDSTARKFVFTGESGSYGAALGQTDNLGVIEAVFYRERERKREIVQGLEREEAGSAAQAPSPKLSDEYAATGMGGRTQHDVTRVDIDLDPRAVASTRIRYEFRPQLVKLGVLPRETSPLQRREKARGFERYCPEPN